MCCPQPRRRWASTASCFFLKSPASNRAAVHHLWTRAARGLVIFTEHKPLISAMASQSSKYTEPEIRQQDFSSQFNLEFRHVQGADNEVAVALSRIEINSLQFPSGIDYTELAAEKNPRELGRTEFQISSPCPLVTTVVPDIQASIRLITEHFAWDGLHDGIDTILHSMPIVQGAPPHQRAYRNIKHPRCAP